MLYVNYISIKLYGGIAGKVFKVKLLELNCLKMLNEVFIEQKHLF